LARTNDSLRALEYARNAVHHEWIRALTLGQRAILEDRCEVSALNIAERGPVCCPYRMGGSERAMAAEDLLAAGGVGEGAGALARSRLLVVSVTDACRP
jgi:hypothetical protein